MHLYKRLRVAVALALWLLSTPAMAQVSWETGVKGGVGLGKLTGDTVVGFGENTPDGVLVIRGDVSSFRTGFISGGFLTAKIHDQFGVRLELLFVQKGGKGDLDVTLAGSPSGTSKVTFKMDYFEIPLLAVGSFPAGDWAFIDVFGGPAIAFKTGAKVKMEFLDQSEEDDISTEVKNTDFGITVGAGISILAHEKVNVVIDGRWTFGFIKFPDVSPSKDLKNNSLAFMAGVSFPLHSGASGP